MKTKDYIILAVLALVGYVLYLGYSELKAAGTAVTSVWQAIKAGLSSIFGGSVPSDAAVSAAVAQEQQSINQATSGADGAAVQGFYDNALTTAPGADTLIFNGGNSTLTVPQ